MIAAAVYLVTVCAHLVCVVAVLVSIRRTDPDLFRSDRRDDQAMLGFLIVILLIGAPLFVLLRLLGRGAQAVSRLGARRSGGTA